ncbi:MAG: hypothetical protein KC619_33935, partial [Myxococcales bacterium]|nr:hypothetical protein [Myxococcales bacterium]
MRTLSRIAVAGLALACAPGLGGCYLLHDSGDPSEIDAAIGFDTGTDPFFDAGPDAGLDGGWDAGFDAGWDAGPTGRDAEPPVGPPPNPETCRIDPPPFQAPILETRWPDDPDMAHGSSVHVCSTPVVADPDPSDGLGDPVIGFISYATLRGEERGILRLWNPRTHETISYPPDESELGVFEATGNLAAGDLDGDGDVEFVGMGVY